MELIPIYDQVEDFLDRVVDDLELSVVFGNTEDAKEALLVSLDKEREDIVLELLVGTQHGIDIDIQLGATRLYINYLNHSEQLN